MPPAYLPDDARVSLSALQFLRTPEGALLRQAVAQLPSAGLHPTVAHVSALRKRFPADALHAALTLAAVQPKATAKFPELAYVWATPEALEQSTHSLVARFKAQQLALGKPAHLFDLCAGIGGDTFALADVAPVTAVDLSPIRTACLAFNAADRAVQPRFPIDIRTGDLVELIDTLPRDAWVHIDPARRSGGKRSPRYEDLIPGPEVLERLFARVCGPGGAGGGVIKLSPAVDFDTLPAGHLQLVSHHGSVVQALLWLGPFPRPAHTRSATILFDALPGWTFEAAPGLVDLKPFALPENPAPDRPAYLYELDGALTRAGLAQAYARTADLTPLTIDGGYLLSEPGAPLLQEPPLTVFQVHTILPFSIARVAGALDHLPPAAPGPIEVKSRGQQQGFDPDQLQKTWSKSCRFGYTVLLFRRDHDTFAAIASRVHKR